MPDLSPNESGPNQTNFLRRRNALWQQLRQAEPGTPEFEETLTKLSAMIGWSRRRVLAGLGRVEASLVDDT
jgi:hypothetical protein